MALFLLHSQTYALSTNSGRVPRQSELCTAWTWKLHTPMCRRCDEYTHMVYYILRRGLVYFAPGTSSLFCAGSGLFCVGVWFTLRPIWFFLHPKSFIYILIIFLIFLYSSFFFLSEIKTILCILHKKKNAIVHYC